MAKGENSALSAPIFFFFLFVIIIFGKSYDGKESRSTAPLI